MAANVANVLINVATVRERLKELRATERPSPPAPPAAGQIAIAEAVEHLLQRAERAAEGEEPPAGRRLTRAWTGRQLEAAYPALHAAEVHLVGLYDEDDVAADMPSVIEFVRQYLDRGDQQRIEAEKLPTLPKDQRRAALQAAWAAGYAAYDLDHRQQRIFRNALIVAIGFSFVLVFLLAGIMFAKPDFAPICFDSVRQEGVEAIPTSTPTPSASPSVTRTATPAPSATSSPGEPAPTTAPPTQAPTAPVTAGAQPTSTPTEAPVATSLRTNCPTGSGQDRSPGGWDVVLVIFFGMIGASLSAAVTVRNLTVTSSPYDIPLVLSILKLPLGALTAFIGVLAIRAGLVPGLSALDSPAEILVYAVILGYAQQIATGVLDRRASSLGRT
jgi:cell division septation protein DedD